MEGLHDMESDSTERRRIVEMLRRLETDTGILPNEDVEGEDDLATRLAGINLDSSPEIVWERLTESERRQFESFVNSGQLTDVIRLWMPWWCGASKALIEDISKSAVNQAIPAVLADIPDITQLTKSAISDVISFSVINILYGYAYSARLYNGDHLAMAVESAHVVTDISDAIGHGVFSDVATAIGGCLSRLESETASAHFVSREYSIAIVSDVSCIVAGPSAAQPLAYVLAALSDCHRIFRTARKEVGKDEILKRSYFAVQKKLEFLLSWVVAHGSVLESLLPALELESCELTTQLAVYQSDRERVEQALAQKKLVPHGSKAPLITEISSESCH
jgi:hypothetical protein